MKRYIFLLFSLSILLGGRGETRVTAEEAQRVASDYYQLVTKETSGNTLVGTPETFSLLGLADMWLVPINDSWILVSTDKRTEAILARFKTQERPNLKLYPPAAQYLISCYEHDIAFVRDSCEKCPVKECWEQPKKMTSQAKQTKSYPSSVEPLLGDLAWNQTFNQSCTYGSPSDCDRVYNKFCPPIVTNDIYLCDHAAAGCVAIAIGQIMHYWHWPYAADVPVSIGGSVKEKRFYDWDLMPPILTDYSSLAEANMTAGFIRDCGYDLNMHYGESSSTSDNNAVNTLKHFGYDPNTISLKQKWATPGWTNMLHEEIAAGRPVYYGGYGSAAWTNGHAFVLDGYDAYDRYHANIGWGPSYNAYYFIDTITVDSNNYSYWQSAIFGIQPKPSTCYSYTMTSPPEESSFCIAYHSEITLRNVMLENVINGKIYSSTGIRLEPGTNIRSGSNVHIAIKEIPCGGTINAMPAINNTTSEQISNNDFADNRISVSPNPAYEIITVHSDVELQTIEIYNLDGQCILQTALSQINISHLPQGFYILRAILYNGSTSQTKFLHL